VSIQNFANKHEKGCRITSFDVGLEKQASIKVVEVKREKKRRES
jgi:hypothetical protein